MSMTARQRAVLAAAQTMHEPTLGEVARATGFTVKATVRAAMALVHSRRLRFGAEYRLIPVTHISDDEARALPGYRAHTRARSTGTVVVLSSLDDGRHRLTCADHEQRVEFALTSEAQFMLRHPEQWCPECQEKP